MKNIANSKDSLPLPGGVMLNAYPDSMGGNLAATVNLLRHPLIKDAFSHFYILPTFFNSDLDRGFSVIDYNLNEELVTATDLEELHNLGITLKLDLVLNHLSVNSPQFRDLLERGDKSPYRDFFIDWNRFWQGHGAMGSGGYVIPQPANLDKLFMRKPELPVMKITFPDGTDRFYWNTFYREVSYKKGEIKYQGQVDLNADSEMVWRFYEETLRKLGSYGAKIVRLDAFAYLHKKPGLANFFNQPETWKYLERLKSIAKHLDLVLLPEIHTSYGSRLHEDIAVKGYPIYDFFFPGLIIDALERGTSEALLRWIDDIKAKKLKTINMLGCHDGIPLLDLRGNDQSGTSQPGLLEDAQIEALVETITTRGGLLKNLYGPDGKKIAYYQVNATYYSALGEDEQKLLLARAVQLFMPGLPQVWYLDLFAGKNDYAAVKQGGPAGHKEINRTNLTLQEIEKGLNRSIVIDQLALIRLRNTSEAFSGVPSVSNNGKDHKLQITWQHGDCRADLVADFKDYSFIVRHRDKKGKLEIITSN
jgi:sucrose phosphorylase